jgi:pyruvate-ferredoxin/flavodoxin oxidoreductase
MLARGIRLWALDTADLARRHAPSPDLLVRMQGVALAGVFLRVSPFAARAGLGRDALLDAVRAQLVRFFGKRGAAVVEANLEVIRAAHDGVIDVTEAIAGRGRHLPAVPILEAG